MADKYIICGNGKKYKLVNEQVVKEVLMPKNDQDLELLTQQVQEDETINQEQTPKQKNKNKAGDN